MTVDYAYDFSDLTTSKHHFTSRSPLLCGDLLPATGQTDQNQGVNFLRRTSYSDKAKDGNWPAAPPM